MSSVRVSLDCQTCLRRFMCYFPAQFNMVFLNKLSKNTHECQHAFNIIHLHVQFSKEKPYETRLAHWNENRRIFFHFLRFCASCVCVHQLVTPVSTPRVLNIRKNKSHSAHTHWFLSIVKLFITLKSLN